MADNKKAVSVDILNYCINKCKAIFASVSHNHDSAYDTKGAANTALTSANEYTDTAVAQKATVQIITWEADD